MCHCDGDVVMSACGESQLKERLAATVRPMRLTDGFSDGGVGVVAAEAIGAEDEGGVWFGGNREGFGFGGAIDIANGSCDKIAVGMGKSLFGGDGSLVDKLLYVRVVVGEGGEAF